MEHSNESYIPFTFGCVFLWKCWRGDKERRIALEESCRCDEDEKKDGCDGEDGADGC